jgi:hypothetical protein
MTEPDLVRPRVKASLTSRRSFQRRKWILRRGESGPDGGRSKSDQSTIMTKRNVEVMWSIVVNKNRL